MRTQLNIDFSKLSPSQIATINSIFAEQHGEVFDKINKGEHCFTLACGGSNTQEKGNPIYVIGSETFRLIPLGNIAFKFNSKSRMTKAEPIYIGDVQMFESVKISESDMKRIHKIMKENNTDLLTDGHDFYTTTDNAIRRIGHKRFYELKSENNDKIRELLYG